MSSFAACQYTNKKPHVTALAKKIKREKPKIQTKLATDVITQNFSRKPTSYCSNQISDLLVCLKWNRLNEKQFYQYTNSNSLSNITFMLVPPSYIARILREVKPLDITFLQFWFYLQCPVQEKIAGYLSLNNAVKNQISQKKFSL